MKARRAWEGSLARPPQLGTRAQMELPVTIGFFGDSEKLWALDNLSFVTQWLVQSHENEGYMRNLAYAVRESAIQRKVSHLTGCKF